jgi:hypothetical protein
VRALAKRALRGQTPVRWGHLRRTRPFSETYGFDRGLPVDRHYIESFLKRFELDIRGRVLEVGDSSYTMRFGGSRVTAHDVVDRSPANPRATIVADLAEVGSLPALHFDCLIVTQTLQYLSDPGAGIANLWHALDRGGTLLLTVPCTSRVDPEARDADRWRLLPRGLELLVRENCPEAEITVLAYGNLLTSIAFLIGLAEHELRELELRDLDEDFPLVACARVRKRA